MTSTEYIENIKNTRGQHNMPDGVYWEGHHIIPVCMGGEGDTRSKHPNIIWLYPHEHFMIHKLLAEENPTNYKLVAAYSYMAFTDPNNERYELTPEEYEQARIYLSKHNPAKTPEIRKIISEKAKNRAYYTGWHHTEEYKNMMSEKMKGRKIEWADKISANAKINPNYGMRGKVVADGVKNKISEALVNYNNQPGVKETKSKNTTKAWEDPEYRAKHCAGMIGKKHKVVKIKCQKCGKEISTSNYNRHYDKCRG